MFATLVSATLLVALTRTVFAQSGFTIDTPTLVQCQEAQITWTATNSPPYDLLIVPADDVCGASLEDLGNQTSLAVTWTVNIAAGTRVVLSLGDSAGEEAWSGTVVIAASNDTSCLASASPTTITVPPGGAVTPAGASSPSSSSAAPAAANAGIAPVSGALSMRPISAITVLSSAVIAFVAFAI